jgi:hypothetical protein
MRRRLVVLLVLLSAVPTLYAVDLPLRATNVVVHVIQYRQYFTNGDGWTPDYKAALDITLQNISKYGIEKVGLCIEAASYELPIPVTPAAGICDPTVPAQSFSVHLEPGGSETIPWDGVLSFNADPATGVCKYTGHFVTVAINEVQYANGFRAYFSGKAIGKGVIPPPIQLPEQSGCQTPRKIYNTSDLVSMPRMVFVSGATPRLPLPASYGRDPQKEVEPITLDYIIGANGAVCSVSVVTAPKFNIVSATVAEERIRMAIESMKQQSWFPALENGIPIASEFVKTEQMEIATSKF